MKKLEWKTEQRKVNDLLPLEINPRKISDEKRKQLIRSIEKFNLAEIPAINKDNTIIAGHQRIKALQIIGRGEEMIDVRIPNRQLNKTELKEYNLLSNTHAGEWDFEILELEFADVKVEEWNFDIPNFDLPEKQNPQQPTKDLSGNIENKFVVEATCVSEREQEKLYNELLKKGYECRLLTL
jgi:hypothetical protein